MALVQITPVARNGYANTEVTNINADNILSVRAATAGEIFSFPTALSAIVLKSVDYNQENTYTLLSASSVAAVKSAVSSAQSGILGAGASGQTTLVAGTKAITIAGLTTSSIALVTLVSSLTGSSTVTYQAVCTANTLTLRANVAAGTINTADVSILNYAIVG